MTTHDDMNRNESKNAACSRRNFLRAAAVAGAIPLAGGKYLLAAAPRSASRFAVFINLKGGNDGMNMLAPTELTKYAERRAGLALTTAQTLSLGSGAGATTQYRLHPAMPQLAALWAEGSVAAVQRVGYPKANLSHFTSQDIWSTGMRGVDAASRGSGWIARYADNNALSSLGTISVGMGRPLDFIGGTTEPLLMRSLGAFRFEVDTKYRNHHEHRLARLRNLVRASRRDLGEDTRRAIQQGHELAASMQSAYSGYTGSASYPSSSPGRQLQDIARLIEANLSTRIFYTGFGGFDTHGAQGTTSGRQATLLDRLDNSIGAFVSDMKRLGRWNDCVLVVFSEFGRRNFINGSGGTDHGGAGIVLVAGGRVRGGSYGPALTNADLEERYLSYAADFRQIFREVLDKHLGASQLDAIFPEALEQSIDLGIVT